MKKILIVDDERKAVEILQIKLSELPFEVDYTLNSALAAEKAASLMPDLVILDILMPEMDGIDVLKALKKAVSTKGIPVVVLTSCDNDALKREALNAGAAEYFRKPPDERFISKVKKLLEPENG